LIEDVAILKKLGLTPMLIHGGGLGIKKKLDKLNIESKFIMGLRVTDKKMIEIVENVMIEFNNKIIEVLEKRSCKAKPITIKENNIIVIGFALQDLFSKTSIILLLNSIITFSTISIIFLSVTLRPIINLLSIFNLSNFFFMPNPPPCINMGVKPSFFKIATSSIKHKVLL
jgi:hypothetical protein